MRTDDREIGEEAQPDVITLNLRGVEAAWKAKEYKCFFSAVGY
jgi:hypothetical protein